MDLKDVGRQFAALGYEVQPPTPELGLLVASQKSNGVRYLTYQEDGCSIGLHEDFDLGGFGRRFSQVERFELLVTPIGKGTCCLSIKKRINQEGGILPLVPIFRELIRALAKSGEASF